MRWLLVSREEFSAIDLDTIEKVAGEMGFETMLSPRSCRDTTFLSIASGVDLDRISASSPVNIAPPTDNKPFFFFMLRLRDMFDRSRWRQGHMQAVNTQAVFILGALLITTVVLTFFCLILPLIVQTSPITGGASPFLLFFGAIGFGFMLVEISQMQRLIIFLGHPVYGLSVVLFALLLSSGIGSYSTQSVPKDRAGMVRLILLLAALVIFGILAPFVVHYFQASTTPIRILVAVLILLPLGFFMGMAFPLGLRVASVRLRAITPWLWALNGASSVCASVVAVAIALTAGISASFWVGTGCYLVALMAFAVAARHQERFADVRLNRAADFVFARKSMEQGSCEPGPCIK